MEKPTIETPALGRKSNTLHPADLHNAVSVNDVLASVTDLFENLGIELDNPIYSVSAQASTRYAQHPLYPYASAIGELLSQWHQDNKYLDRSGNPALIKIEGRAPSFQSLARIHAPNLKYRFLLKELLKLGVISRHKRSIGVNMRFFPAYEDKRIAIQHTLATLNGFIKTLNHNLNSAPSNANQLFHRIARSGEFDRTQIPALKIRLKRYAQHFLESFDSYLARKSFKRAPNRRTPKDEANVAIGIYLSID